MFIFSGSLYITKKRHYREPGVRCSALARISSGTQPCSAQGENDSDLHSKIANFHSGNDRVLKRQLFQRGQRTGTPPRINLLLEEPLVLSPAPLAR